MSFWKPLAARPSLSKAERMQRDQMKSLFFGGLLPIVAFTVIEEWKGPVWGTIVALIFGAGEIIYEWRRDGKVSAITWTSNAFIFVLGIVSIYTQEGLWFKLQPAFLVLIMALWLIVSSLRKTPLLVALAEKQNPNIPAEMKDFFGKINMRLGFFFLAMTALSVHAAFYWTTAEWAFLKGLGVPILMGVYMVIEIVIFRLRMKPRPPPDSQ